MRPGFTSRPDAYVRALVRAMMMALDEPCSAARPAPPSGAGAEGINQRRHYVSFIGRSNQHFMYIFAVPKPFGTLWGGPVP